MRIATRPGWGRWSIQPSVPPSHARRVIRAAARLSQPVSQGLHLTYLEDPIGGAAYLVDTARYKVAATVEARHAAYLYRGPIPPPDADEVAAAREVLRYSDLGALDGGRRRFARYIEAFAGNHDAPLMLHYPELPSLPFHDAGRFPIASALEAAYPEIRREVLALDEAGFHAESESIRRTGRWDVFMLYERGRKNEARCARLPTATRLIESHASVRTLAGLIYVSRMKPGTHVEAHRGPTNLRIRCHLGIDIPDGDCAIRVHAETRRWVQGKCLLLDDYFEHEAWNRTQADRIVLIIDLWHPDLTSEEIRLLEGLHRYAAAQGRSLSSYWAGNDRAAGKHHD